MGRKRNFARHNITVVNQTGANTTITYSRVKGLVQPPAEFYALEIDPTGTSVRDKLELYVKTDLINFTDEPTTWSFLWEDRVYSVFGTRDFSHYGKDSYQKFIGIYDSRETYPFVEPDWNQVYGVDGFIPAVDSLEVIVEMKLNHVLDNRNN